MSFADSVREELCELIIKKPCCRRALVAGMLLCAERASGKETHLRCRYEGVAALAEETIAKVYGKAPVTDVTGAHGHRYWDLVIQSPACAKLVTQLHAAECDLQALLRLDDCEGCRSAFLRGLFLVSGSVSDPQKLAHLELALPLDAEAMASCVLTDCGYPPKRVARGGSAGLYYKDATSVGDLLTLMGSHHMIFEFYNARIANDIRNNENRATNCVARNIEKSVSAAARQMEAIGHLMESGRLDSLPEPLRVTAWLRYRNPDATLDELKELHQPPISKSGLNHRLQKLMDAAEQSHT
ncbi:MAG: DNA-binding protein WhiA [Clostridia bacterium]|nr:DNA-binding protein WhiA [Clostridia bacterium]